jgi:hypothetical protein
MSIIALLQEYAWHKNFMDIPNYYDHIKPIEVNFPTKDFIISPRNVASMTYFSKKFKPSDYEHMSHYKSASGGVNGRLRQSKPLGLFKREAQALRKITSHKFTTPESMYRSNQVGNIPIGKTFTDKGFTSTTLYPHIARNFSGVVDGNIPIFAIHAPIGTKAYHIDRHNHNMSNENEVLLHPNSHFEVIGHSIHPFTGNLKNLITHVAIIGQGWHSHGNPDYTLSKTPENTDWLSHIKKHHIAKVTGESS